MDDSSTPIKTRAVNRYREPFDTYAGRPVGGHDPRGLRPGEYGWLGNPFPSQDRTDSARQQSIDAFRKYFLARAERDQEFAAAVRKLAGQRLGCFCRPKACHAEVIAAWIDGRPEQQQLPAKAKKKATKPEPPMTLF